MLVPIHPTEIEGLRENLRLAYMTSKNLMDVKIPKSKNSPFFKSLRDDIYFKIHENISKGTLWKLYSINYLKPWQERNIVVIKKYINICIPDVPTKWIFKEDKHTPQGSSYLQISRGAFIVKKLTCKVKTTNKYYRFGFKFFIRGGSLFGDNTIKSSVEPNVVVHIGKNKEQPEILVTAYYTGPEIIRNLPTQFIDNEFTLRFEIGFDEMFHLFLNDEEIFTYFIKERIRQEVYMFAWADNKGKFEIQVEDIQVSYKNG